MYFKDRLFYLKFQLEYKEALYVGAGRKEVIFKSEKTNAPAKFYINSAPAHQSFPIKKVTVADANILELGALETANARTVKQMLVASVVQTCQLQMGMTELKVGSIWAHRLI